MLWHALDVPHQYGATYRSETHDIRHYAGGFGIWVAQLYRRGGFNTKPVREFAGADALTRAQAAAVVDMGRQS